MNQIFIHVTLIVCYVNGWKLGQKNQIDMFVIFQILWEAEKKKGREGKGREGKREKVLGWEMEELAKFSHC